MTQGELMTLLGLRDTDPDPRDVFDADLDHALVSSSVPYDSEEESDGLVDEAAFSLSDNNNMFFDDAIMDAAVAMDDDEWTNVYGGTDRWVSPSSSGDVKTYLMPRDDFRAWLDAREDAEMCIYYRKNPCRKSQDRKRRTLASQPASRRRAFDYSETYWCNRAGNPRKERIYSEVAPPMRKRPRLSKDARPGHDPGCVDVGVESADDDATSNDDGGESAEERDNVTEVALKKKRPMQKESGKVGCKAAIHVKYFKDTEEIE
ncbi:hypothetical protein BGX28_001457, partial [Mortierella sp. GBA30]